MAKVRVPCSHCRAKMSEGTSFCPTCGYPTRWTPPGERVRWEARQWRKVQGLPTNDDGPPLPPAIDGPPEAAPRFVGRHREGDILLAGQSPPPKKAPATLSEVARELRSVRDEIQRLERKVLSLEDYVLEHLRAPTA